MLNGQCWAMNQFAPSSVQLAVYLRTVKADYLGNRIYATLQLQSRGKKSLFFFDWQWE